LNGKKIIICILTLLFLINGIVFGKDNGKVYVVPIKGEINKATYQFLKSTIDDILKENPKAIIFEIDTYGGLIDQTEKIKNLIYGLDIPTISYVNNKAESAGVLITISSEKVVMAESSTIGSAETIPDTEKVMSMWKSFLRDMAEERGRDSEIIEAMADRDIDIEGITVKGKLLNLTSREALKYNIADYISNDYKDMLNHFNINYSSIVTINEGIEVKFAKFVSNPYMSTLLLTIGFIGLLIEIFTPGFGIGGTLSILAFSIFFGGNLLAGSSETSSIILFVTGLILLIIEGMIPGFGLPGIGGIILLIAGVILAVNSVTNAIISLGIAIVITAIIAIILVKLGKRSPMFNKIVLETELKDDKGYLSSSRKDEYLNKEGITITELRPSGIIEIDGKRIDALSEGSYINKNVSIKVVRVEGSKIFVRRV